MKEFGPQWGTRPWRQVFDPPMTCIVVHEISKHPIDSQQSMILMNVNVLKIYFERFGAYAFQNNSK